jgi:hypothetical protein
MRNLSKRSAVLNETEIELRQLKPEKSTRVTTEKLITSEAIERAIYRGFGQE